MCNCFDNLFDCDSLFFILIALLIANHCCNCGDSSRSCC